LFSSSLIPSSDVDNRSGVSETVNPQLNEGDRNRIEKETKDLDEHSESEESIFENYRRQRLKDVVTASGANIQQLEMSTTLINVSTSH
jgi:hypothetical protein